MYDATEIFRTLSGHKKESFFKLGFYLLSFFYYLYRCVRPTLPLTFISSRLILEQNDLSPHRRKRVSERARKRESCGFCVVGGSLVVLANRCSPCPFRFFIYRHIFPSSIRLRWCEELQITKELLNTGKYPFLFVILSGKLDVFVPLRRLRRLQNRRRYL
jgi:hypothetical protein